MCGRKASSRLWTTNTFIRHSAPSRLPVEAGSVNAAMTASPGPLTPHPSPLAYSDPFGLCTKEDGWADCKWNVFSMTAGPRLGFEYKAEAGPLKAKVTIGVEVHAGVRHQMDAVTHAPSNQVVAGAKATVGGEITAWGHGPKWEPGPRAGVDREDEAVSTTPLEGDGTLTVGGTVPLLWAGPVPIGGIQVESRVNFFAAYLRLRDGLNSLLGH